MLATRNSRLKIILAIRLPHEVLLLQAALESLGHTIEICTELPRLSVLLRTWHPDLIVADETLRRFEPDGGIQLAKMCRNANNNGAGREGIKALLLLPSSDWIRFNRARHTGAHVIVKSANFEAVLRYVQTVADDLMTDRMLGPVLTNFHRFNTKTWDHDCRTCAWEKCSVGYGQSEADLVLTPVRAAVLNVLMLRRRAQSYSEMMELADARRSFFAKILKNKKLTGQALKMEISRLRKDLGLCLEKLGAPCRATDFLPVPQYGVGKYWLSGNWRIVHLPKS